MTMASFSPPLSPGRRFSRAPKARRTALPARPARPALFAWPARPALAALLVGLATLASSGCQEEPALEPAAQTIAVDRVQRDLAYGEHARQRLDLYLPPGGAGPAPVVVFFHGGAFIGGDKAQLPPDIIAELNARGVAVASANYRFVFTDPLPAAMHDGARVVQSLRARAADFGLDPERFAVTGASAGGGIALWVALHDDLADPRADDAAARASSRVSAAWVQGAQVSYDPRDWVAYGLARVAAEQPFPLLYGLAPQTARDDPAFAAAAEATAPIRLLTADDPPLRLDYGASPELSATTTLENLLHHPNHGLALQRAAAPLGVPCEVNHGASGPPPEPGLAFLLRSLGVQ